MPVDGRIIVSDVVGASAIQRDPLDHTFGPYEAWSTSDPLPVGLGVQGQPAPGDGGSSALYGYSGIDYLGSRSIAGDDRPPAVILAEIGLTDEGITAPLA